ncbi:MAG: UDP-glucose-4-epimerase [Phylliscum demangeonii]|nr:MAG: UDP-glucose-4-epimerase [Phylliscum demangeonii]
MAFSRPPPAYMIERKAATRQRPQATTGLWLKDHPTRGDVSKALDSGRGGMKAWLAYFRAPRLPIPNLAGPVPSMTLGSVLVTGGTGYIGSFTALALLEAGYRVVIVDNLYNSSAVVLDRIELICQKRPDFIQCDITDEDALDAVFTAHPDIDSVIHFAALKAVGESAEVPLEYYRVNVYGTICLLRAMTRHHVTHIVFSSSATVYGDVTRLGNMIPIPEDCPIAPTNPYGRTKVAVEHVIADHIEAQRSAGNGRKAGREWNGALLRYFNPVGAHPTGLMGEDPQGVPYNLLPLLGQVAIGKRDKLLVYGNGTCSSRLRHLAAGVKGSRGARAGAERGLVATRTTDYGSRDGTCVRDYIHIQDLAAGHLSALAHLRRAQPGVRAWNLGTGTGSTVLQMVQAFSHAVGRDLPYEIVPRRSGDVLDLTANPDRALRDLGWRSHKTLHDACVDLWCWVRHNPRGYRDHPPHQLLLRARDRAGGGGYANGGDKK